MNSLTTCWLVLMVPLFSMASYVGALVPILLFAARGLLLPFLGLLLKSLFKVFHRQTHTGEALSVKDGLDILHEGSNPDVE